MYIHLGEKKVVQSAHVVAIFNISLEQFLLKASHNDEVETIGNQRFKSLVVTAKKIYYSPISVMTLKKRAHDY